MPDGKTFKENIAEEKQKLSGMNLKQKISYLKTYYLTAALIILAVIIAGVWIFIESTLSRRNIEAAGVFINVEADNACYTFLTSGYEEYKDMNLWKSKVTLSTGDYIDFSPELQMMDSYQSQMALHAQISTGFFTYMIVDRNALEGLRYLDVYLDPNLIFTERSKEVFQDAVVSLDMPVGDASEGEMKEMPVALDLGKIGFTTAASMNQQSAYLVFIDVDADYENMKEFLEYFCTYPSILR
ncbi:MAG: hypothetical protein E7288_06750 [Lachnospiraceae bacterium]|nr:hypothetical protein [Lachnospiraceae bacterium]